MDARDIVEELKTDKLVTDVYNIRCVDNIILIGPEAELIGTKEAIYLDSIDGKIHVKIISPEWLDKLGNGFYVVSSEHGDVHLGRDTIFVDIE